MDTSVLRISQILGYYPISLPNQPKSQKNQNNKPNLIQYIPILLFSFITIVDVFMIFAYLFGYVQGKGDTNITRKLISTTLYSTLVLKATAHTATSIFVRFRIFLGRKQLLQFHTDFTTLVEYFSIFSNPTGLESLKIKRNRYEFGLKVEVILVGFICTLLITDLWHGYLTDAGRGGKYS